MVFVKPTYEFLTTVDHFNFRPDPPGWRRLVYCKLIDMFGEILYLLVLYLFVFNQDQFIRPKGCIHHASYATVIELTSNVADACGMLRPRSIK